MIKTKIRTFLGVCIVSALAACGGGGGGDDSTVAATDTVIGTITAFGSVVVNGIEFDDASASISIDGAAAARNRLREGMVVQVRGRIRSDGSGVADSIEFNDCVQGPIAAMNRVQNTVTVLGQTVEVDDETVFDGVTLRDMNSFSIGDAVEVSCLQDRSRNRLRATRMERLGAFQNGVTDIDITGTVQNLNLANRTCTVSGVLVNFTSVADPDLPVGFANGMTLRASGKQFSGGTFTADRLRDRDRDRISHVDGDRVEIEGYISNYVSISDFRIDGQRVNASSAVIRNGTAADLANGLKVEAEGTMAGEVLNAAILRIRQTTNVRIEARVQARDTAAGEFTLLGQTVRVTDDTSMADRLTSASQPESMVLADLAVGDRVEVQAFKDAAGTLSAMRVQRTPADELVVVKAGVDSKTVATRMVLSGIGVATGTNTRYRDANGDLVTAAAFYAAVAVPPAQASVVHARGVVAGLSAIEVDAERDASSIGEVELRD